MVLEINGNVYFSAFRQLSHPSFPFSFLRLLPQTFALLNVFTSGLLIYFVYVLISYICSFVLLLFFSRR